MSLSATQSILLSHQVYLTDKIDNKKRDRMPHMKCVCFLQPSEESFEALAAELRQNWNVEFDDSGAIGRRYRRQDEIGTPFCVTVDFETLDDDAVTVRERDTMSQERVSLDRISAYFAEKLLGC